MNNFEKRINEILKTIKRNSLSSNICVKDGVLEECYYNCYECDLRKKCNRKNQFYAFLDWLTKEYTPPKYILTKEQRAFCELVGKGWIVRKSDKTLIFTREDPMLCLRENYKNFIVLNKNTYPDFDFIICGSPMSISRLLALGVEEDV